MAAEVRTTASKTSLYVSEQFWIAKLYIPKLFCGLVSLSRLADSCRHLRKDRTQSVKRMFLFPCRPTTVVSCGHIFTVYMTQAVQCAQNRRAMHVRAYNQRPGPARVYVCDPQRWLMPSLRHFVAV